MKYQKLSDDGFELIVKVEGVRLKSYLDTRGIWTVGIGHTKTAHKDQVISNTQVHELFETDSLWVENCINNEDLSINQNQFDALFSLVFNIGETQWRTSTLRRYLKKGIIDPKSINFAWKMWNKETINGIKTISNGAVNRRNKELELFFKKKT